MRVGRAVVAGALAPGTSCSFTAWQRLPLGDGAGCCRSGLDQGAVPRGTYSMLGQYVFIFPGLVQELIV